MRTRPENTHPEDRGSDSRPQPESGDGAVRRTPQTDEPSPLLPTAVDPQGARAERALYRDDEPYESVTDHAMAELFAEALARLEEGETINAILAGLPPETASELHGMLLISQSLLAIQHAPLPARNPTRMRARRSEFINQIALEQTRQQVEHPEALPPAPVYSGYRPPTQTPASTNAAGLQRLGARVPATTATTPPRTTGRPQPAQRSWLQRLADSLSTGRMRLMPLIVTLTIAAAAALGLAQATQASLPGDLTYPIKVWVQMMNLNLAAPEERAAVSQQAAQSLQADFALSAARAQQRASAGESLELVVQRESVSLVFEGYDGRLLKFGDIRVVPSYQPNPNDAATLPMEISGDLRPGALVRLTVQILPGQADLVQGVRAEVRQDASQSVQDAPAVGSADTEATAPTAPEAETATIEAAPTREGAEMLMPRSGATPVPCTPKIPDGWGTYRVVRGDHLTSIARASATTVRAIAGANCLDSDVIITGQKLFVPLNGTLPVEPPAGSAETPAP